MGDKSRDYDKPLKVPYVVGERELHEARLIAEEAKRAWREEHDARIEAEEAKTAVTRAAEEAIEEANELKKKLSLELEEAKRKTREAIQARKIFEEAKNYAEEAKNMWREAAKARAAKRSDDGFAVPAQEAEQRMEYVLKWVE